MTYQKVEGGHHSIKSLNKATGNNKPIILYERNLETLMSMCDYVANTNGCRVDYKYGVMKTKGNYDTVIHSIAETYNFIVKYSSK